MPCCWLHYAGRVNSSVRRRTWHHYGLNPNSKPCSPPYIPLIRSFMRWRERASAMKVPMSAHTSKIGSATCRDRVGPYVPIPLLPISSNKNTDDLEITDSNTSNTDPLPTI